MRARGPSCSLGTCCGLPVVKRIHMRILLRAPHQHSDKGVGVNMSLKLCRSCVCLPSPLAPAPS